MAVADATSGDDEELVSFVAWGMLLNAAAAMDLTSVMDLPWVAACLGAVSPRDHGVASGANHGVTGPSHPTPAAPRR